MNKGRLECWQVLLSEEQDILKPTLAIVEDHIKQELQVQKGKEKKEDSQHCWFVIYLFHMKAAHELPSLMPTMEGHAVVGICEPVPPWGII